MMTNSNREHETTLNPAANNSKHIDSTNNLSAVMIAVVAVAIVIISLLTITAIWNGPPA